MNSFVGIRREDKNRWERRVPLVPVDVARLKGDKGVACMVQPSTIRVFSDDEFLKSGARVEEDLSACRVVLGIKEFPVSFLDKGRTYLFFSHTVKGQKHNMGMLKRMMELGCDLMDYELITDSSGRRLIFFGRHAGLAGMIDTLWAVGKRLATNEGLVTPFLDLEPAWSYPDLQAAKEAVSQVGRRISDEGLPSSLNPFVCGITGYGNVSKGAQEIYDLLPFESLTPQELLFGFGPSSGDRRKVYKVVFEEKHLARPLQDGQPFVLEEYYEHPERYTGLFEPFIGRLTVLANCIYWDERYPRLVTRKALQGLLAEADRISLRVIGDISCDVEGSIEATVKATSSDDPVFVFDPRSGSAQMGFDGDGVCIMAVDNLPCELPRESSEHFSSSLAGFIPVLAATDFKAARIELPRELEDAMILRRGELTERFRHLSRYIP